MQKLNYVSPEIDIRLFEPEDIISWSSSDEFGEGIYEEDWGN